MKAVKFRAKEDGGVRNSCFKVVLTDIQIDLLLILIMSKHNKGHRKCLIATCLNEELEIPINIVSAIHSYCFEIYGLKKNYNTEEMHYDCVGYTRRWVTVGKGGGEEDGSQVVFNLEEQSSCFPLSWAEENLDINISNKPVSLYKVKGSCTYDNDKTFITILKQPESGFKFFVHKDKKLKYKIPFDLTACRNYEVKTMVGFVIFENAAVTTLGIESHSKVVAFKTLYTKTEYYKLYDKTTTFTDEGRENFYTIKYLYRNKSEKYFTSIMNSDGIMTPYKKDYNGDPYSVINGHLNGLFFSTALDFRTLKPMAESLYGPRRLHIEATTLFTSNVNAYFADFYCHYHVHYVTIVLTPKSSTGDLFCRKRLLRLDINDNPFIYLNQSSKDMNEVKVYLKTGLRVEIFYTEQINIALLLRNKKCFFKTVPIIYRGESRPEGLPKNKTCSVCNI